MNDCARDVLVEAQLRGARQIRIQYHNSKGGYCAYGILHLKAHGDNLLKAQKCSDIRTCMKTKKLFGLSQEEIVEILYRNDVLLQDFLTIARKTGDSIP